jgi:hypothetical protein
MSDMVKALGMALGARKYKDKPPIALCPNCEAPLIGTIVFPGAEFYCLDCGAHCSFVAPIEGDPFDEGLTAKLKEFEAEWEEHVIEPSRAARKLGDSEREWLKKRRDQQK